MIDLMMGTNQLKMFQTDDMDNNERDGETVMKQVFHRGDSGGN